MELTGKCKEEFESWYLNYIYDLREDYKKYVHQQIFSKFYREIDSMKYGAYVDYFDSIGLNILLTVEFDYGYIITENRYQEIEEVKKWYDTRQEARTAAIEKANYIRNEQLNK